MIKSIWCIISERINSGLILLITESSRDKFKIIFELKVFRLFEYHLLITFYTSDSHLNTNHHVQNHVPVIITEKYHVSFSTFDFFMNILNCLFFLFFINLLIRSIIVFLKLLEKSSILIQYFLYSCFNII